MSLGDLLKKYQNEGKNVNKNLKGTRNFIEKQIKVDEKKKESKMNKGEETSLWNPDSIGRIGMKDEELKIQFPVLRSMSNT